MLIILWLNIQSCNILPGVARLPSPRHCYQLTNSLIFGRGGDALKSDSEGINSMIRRHLSQYLSSCLVVTRIRHLGRSMVELHQFLPVSWQNLSSGFDLKQLLLTYHILVTVTELGNKKVSLKVIVTVTDDFQFQYKKILIWTPKNCHCNWIFTVTTDDMGLYRSGEI